MTDDIDDSDHQQHHGRRSGKSRNRSRPGEVTGRHHRHHHHGNSKHRPDGHHRHKETGEEEDRRRKPSQTVATGNEGEDGPFFYVDRTGDPENVLYGGNHSGIVPRYRKAGRGSLIGVRRWYRVSEDGSKAFEEGHAHVNPGRRHASSLLNFRDDSRLELEQVKAEKTWGEQDAIKLQQEYIRVDTNNAKRRKRNTSNGDVHDALHIVTGRSIDPVSKRDENKSEGSGSESDSTASVESDGQNDYERFRNDVRRQQAIELNRATLERPNDIDTWLALIAHQSQLFESDNGALNESSLASSKQTLAEVKLELYQKALTRVTDPASRNCLTEGLMLQGAIVWDVETLSNKWQAVLKTSSSMDLWVHYLNFRQTTSVSFSYEECLSIHEECLRRARSETDLTIRDEKAIYILLRITTLMSQSGYSERATAVWQALLEFMFFRPEQLDPSIEHSSFQAFWESEILRTGEPGATGWARSKSDEVPTRSDAAPSNLCSDDLYGCWANRESEVMVSSTMPARTLDDVSEHDPFRVILYSDISEYLFRPSTKTGHILFINAFLKFCGLPAVYHPKSQTHRRWWGDEFLSSYIKGGRHSIVENTALSGTRILFSEASRSSVFCRAVSEDGTDKAVWQRTALKQLVRASADDDALAEYVIALEGCSDADGGRKYAKSLLKSRPSNLRLYNAYALLECRMDKFESAEHVWSTAIKMCQSASTLEQQDLVLLWSDWVFECLRQGNVIRAKNILLSITNSYIATGSQATEAFSNAAVRLRTKNYLESHLSRQLSLRQDDGVLHLTELLAIFEYLAESQSISAALRVYNITSEALGKIPESSLLLEVLHQSRSRLLHLHPTLSPRGYRPAEINRHLAESLCTFPGNSFFHQLYQEHTRQSGLLERIREVMPTSKIAQERREKDTSVVPLVFAIQAEISRPGYAGSTNHSIRAAFERGVDVAKACVNIWNCYIRWEVSLNDELQSVAETTKSRSKREMAPRRNKSVDIYFRAIRACPWAKELYMLGFSEAPLRKAIGGVELRKIYDAMLEKGLRLHVDLDQIEN